MSKTGKLLISLIFLSFFAFLYLVITIENDVAFVFVPSNNYKNIQKHTADFKEMELNYRKNIKDILNVYLDLINSNNLDQEKVQDLKNKLIALTVPPQYRNLHIQLLTIMNKMQFYLKSGDEDVKLAQENILNNLYRQYQWLNN